MARLYIYPPTAVTVDTGPLATSANQLIMIGELEDINTELDSQTVIATTQAADVATIAATDFATEAKQDTQITAATSTNTKLDTLIAKDYATSAKQDEQTVILENVDANITLIASDAEDSKVAVQSLAAKSASALVTAPYDFQSLSYVAAGNGIGEVETITYKLGGSGGTLVSTVTLGYDSSNRVISVTKA